MSQYDLVAVLDFVKRAISDSELNTICLGRFPDVYGSFSAGMTRDAKIDALVEHAHRRFELDDLISAVAQVNPKAYEHFISELTPERQGRQVTVGVKRTSGCDILLLAANPKDTTVLELDAEADLIQERLSEGEHGRSMRVIPKRAVRAEDLSRHLLEYEPTIVHFSGHGSPTGEILLAASDGTAQRVSAEALAGLFAAIDSRIECVVLNACYSVELADELRTHVDCIVGMSREINDDAATRFAAGFYRGVAFGRDYSTSFEIGRNEIDLLELQGKDVPHFIAATARVLDRSVTGQRSRQAGTQPVRSTQQVPVYPLWFATNRAPHDPTDATKGFSGRRDSTVHHGTCSVVVPESHKIGSLGSGWWKRLLTWTDDRLRLRTDTLSVSPAAAFWQELRNTIIEHDPGERVALVYIHGYNVSFTDAALRAAQLGVDLQVPGITAFFSWPSMGTLAGYSADEASIEASEEYIGVFLTELANQHDVERVHVVAHSMGNRALLRSLNRIIDRVSTRTTTPFGQVFLAAADVDSDTFRRLAVDYERVAERTTLYVSSKDRALASSQMLHRYPRAGLYPPITIVPAIDTVQCNNIDLTFLGHGYYAEARDMLHDMHRLLNENSPPDRRMGLRRRTASDGNHYWEIKL